MVNLGALNNISALNINSSIVEGDVIEDVSTTFVTNVPYWLMPVTIIFFITLTWFLYKKVNWGLNIVQAALVGAFMNTILSYTLLKMGWTISAIPLSTWGIIWVLLLISVFFIKKRG